MKRLLILALCLFCASMPMMAQSSENSQENKEAALKQLEERGIKLRMAYRDYKDKYDAREYVREAFQPYSPVGAGIASFFIPGLGQIINGEGGRGALILGGDILLVAAAIVVPAVWTTTSGGDAPKTVATKGAQAISVLCLSGCLALDIWSICDAVHMAKIKNLYYKDCKLLMSSNVDLKLKPSLTYVPSGSGFQPAPGLTLALKF